MLELKLTGRQMVALYSILEKIIKADNYEETAKFTKGEIAKAVEIFDKLED